MQIKLCIEEDLIIFVFVIENTGSNPNIEQQQNGLINC